MLKNLKIGHRLMTLVALLSVFMGLIGMIGIDGIKETDAALDTVYNDRVVPLRDLKIIADMYAVNIVDTTHKARNGSLSHAEALANIDVASKTIHGKWKSYLATFLVPEEKKLVAEIEPLMALADQAVARVRLILETGQAEPLAEFASRALYPAIDPVSEKFAALIDVQIEVAKAEYDTSQLRYHSRRTAMIALLVGALVLGLAAGYAIIRSITRPLHQVSALIERLAKGDLSVEIADDGRADEIGQMVRAAALIVATLKAVAGDLGTLIEAARAGTLSSRADPAHHAGEFAVLVKGVNDLVEILTAPLFEVAAVMAKLASGDVRGRISGAYEGDLRALKGNVNRSLDALVSLLEEISVVADAMAAGDLTRSVEGSYQGDFAAIKVNLNQAGAQLRGVIGEVASSTQHVAISATQTTAAAIDVSRQAASQMTTLADVSSAIEQTAAAVGEIARSAEQASALARDTATAAENGQAKLVHLSAAVESIQKGNTRIGQISSLITTIADKTYVLALNAGLEAVRAGEHGRGFGLIAHQITKLAEEVAQATRDIRNLIEEAGGSVLAGVAAAQSAGSAITQIVGSARESGATVQAIAAAIDEQNAMAQVLKDRVGHLHMVGQTTAGAAEEISATMASLTEMAQRLKTASDRIRYA
jgi:methyl-accepting chemotaxis protein